MWNQAKINILEIDDNSSHNISNSERFAKYTILSIWHDYYFEDILHFYLPLLLEVEEMLLIMNREKILIFHALQIGLGYGSAGYGSMYDA